MQIRLKTDIYIGTQRFPANFLLEAEEQYGNATYPVRAIHPTTGERKALLPGDYVVVEDAAPPIRRRLTAEGCEYERTLAGLQAVIPGMEREKLGR